MVDRRGPKYERPGIPRIHPQSVLTVSQTFRLLLLLTGVTRHRLKVFSSIFCCAFQFVAILCCLLFFHKFIHTRHKPSLFTTRFLAPSTPQQTYFYLSTRLFFYLLLTYYLLLIGKRFRPAGIWRPVYFDEDSHACHLSEDNCNELLSDFCDPSLDLGFGHFFYFFLHHGIENVDRHLL